MTNEELLDGFEIASKEYNGPKLTELRAELLRLLGAAVLASAHPRCPMHKTEMVQKINGIPFWVCSTDGCDLFISAEIIKQVAQFFAAAPAQERWYTKAEFHDALIARNYEPKTADELAGWIADQLELAYKKGKERAQERPENNWPVCDKCQKSHIPLEKCAQEQPVENSPQDDFENKFIGNWKDAKPLKCCEVCGETEMLTVMGRNKYACPKHRAVSTAQRTER